MNKVIRDILFELIPIFAGSFLLYHVLFYLLKKWAKYKKQVIPGQLNKYIYFPGLMMYDPRKNRSALCSKIIPRISHETV